MTIETLMTQIADDPLFSCDAVFGYLTRLLAAPAPNSGACLPGAVGEVIGDIAGELGLSLSTDPRILATGNLAVEIGAESDAADLLITAHMDRPSFRVLNLSEATLVSALRDTGSASAISLWRNCCSLHRRTR